MARTDLGARQRFARLPFVAALLAAPVARKGHNPGRPTTVYRPAADGRSKQRPYNWRSWRPMWSIARLTHNVDAPSTEANPTIAPAVDFRRFHGPFDIVGDIHGCYDELRALLGALGYRLTDESQPDGEQAIRVAPPSGRLLILLGDLVDRGPLVVPTLRLAMGLLRDGTGLYAPGNHDDKLRRWLRGRPVHVAHGLQTSIDQLEAEPRTFCDRTLAFLQGLPPYLILDESRLICAHAGLPLAAQGRDDRRARDLALYGATTGERDEAGYPVRIRWAETYRGEAFVVYGHTPVRRPEWIGNTVNIDTGCVFGGSLTALRWPERETVSVPAFRVYDPNGRFDGRPTDDEP